MQSAITSDVVEGTPDRMCSKRTSPIDRANEGLKGMNDQLWNAGRPGREKDPLGLSTTNIFGRWRKFLRLMNGASKLAKAIEAFQEIGHDSIDICPGYHSGQQLRRKLVGANDDPASNSVESDERQRGTELIAGIYKDAAVSKGLGRRAVSRTARESTKLQARTGVGNEPGSKIAIACDEAPEPLVVTLRHFRRIRMKSFNVTGSVTSSAVPNGSTPR